MTALEKMPSKYRLRVDDYRMLDEAGAFADHHTELIEGEVILLSPEYRPHLFIKNELAFLLRLALRDLGSALYVATDGSVLLSDHDEPRPDIILTSEPRGEGPIPAASVALLVEVADSSKPFDTGVKRPLYARSGIPEYWIVDVRRRTVQLFWSPGPDGYADDDERSFGETIRARTIAELEVGTGELA